MNIIVVAANMAVAVEPLIASIIVASSLRAGSFMRTTLRAGPLARTGAREHGAAPTRHGMLQMI
jgi:hypothetical protein